MVTSTENRQRSSGIRSATPLEIVSLAAILPLAAILTACGSPSSHEGHSGYGETWSVTAWGKSHEVFQEVDALIAGEGAVARARVTSLDGFEPLAGGRLEIVFSDASGEQVFAAEPDGPGRFSVDVTPERTGEFDLSFRIHDSTGSDEASTEKIRGGRVRVGTAEEPGGVVVAPAPRGASDGGEPLAFEKDQQWRSDFGTSWVRSGSLDGSVSGLARTRPSAGGDALITAPVGGIARAPSGRQSWPFVGRRVEGGAPLFRIGPRVLEAPFAGALAAVDTTPGATVRAGDTLARLVSTDVVWIEVEVPPAGARTLEADGVRGIVLDDSEHAPLRIEDDLKLISIAPEVSPHTGTVTVLLEVTQTEGLMLGTTLEAMVLTGKPHEGIVIPSSALIDDGGVPIVYLQLAGESFVRQQVRVLERQGDRVLVERLVPGQRLVSRGGDAIRRESLMASGQAHGHVH